MAKKSRPENSQTAKIVVLWETLTTALRKLRAFSSRPAAPAAEGKINKDSEFRGAFDSSSSRFGATILLGRCRFLPVPRNRKRAPGSASGALEAGDAAS
jgi:hypothetical protein